MVAFSNLMLPKNELLPGKDINAIKTNEKHLKSLFNDSETKESNLHPL